MTEEFETLIESFKKNKKNYVELFNQARTFGHVFQYLRSDSSISDEFRFEEGKIILKNDAILNRNIANGEYEISIRIVGYHRINIGILLEKACAEAPDVTVSIDENNDLKIVSSDQTWLNSLKSGYLEFGLGGTYRSISGERLLISEGSAVLKAEAISNAGLEDGTYSLILNSRGYGRVTISIELSGYARAVEAEVLVSGESGDLVITCDDVEFLNALASKRISQNSNNSYEEISAGGNIDIIADGTYTYIANSEFRNLDNGYTNELIYITVEGNQAIVSNDDLISFAELTDTDNAIVELHAPGFKMVTVNGVTIRNVRSTYVPETVTVTAEDGDLIVDSNDKEWLKALCVASDYSQGKGKPGGQILLRSETDGYNRTYSNSVNNVNVLMTYDQQRQVVRIYGQTLKKFRVKNDTYILSLQPYKYKKYEYGQIEISSGVKASPTDITASINADKALEISCPDPDWVADLASDPNSYIYLDDGNGTYYYVGPEQIVELDGKAVISSEELTSLAVSAGTYFVEISPYSYETFTVSDVQIGNYASERTAEVSVSCTDGSLVITCDDQEYLNALVKDSKAADENNPYRTVGGRVALYSDASSGEFKNELVTKNETQEHKVELHLDGNTVTISNADLINKGVVDSEETHVYLYAYGYKFVSIDNVSIQGAIQPDVIEDVEVAVNENGDLEISSGNTTWLQALCEDHVHQETPKMQGGKLSFKSKDGTVYEIVNTEEEQNYYYEDGKIIFPAERQIKARMYNGLYSLNLQAYKYQTVTYGQDVELTKAYHVAPEGVQIIASDGNIIIRGGDEDWKYALTSDSESIIKLKDSAGEEYLFDITDLTAEEEQIVLSSDVLKEAGIVNGEYELYLYAYGYDGVYGKVTIDYPIEFNVSIIQDPDTKDLIISSNDPLWISDLAKLYEEEYEKAYFADGSSIEMYGQYAYFEFGQKDSFKIRYEALLANYVSSGRQSITFPNTESRGAVTVDLDFDLDACRQFPQDLKVEETPEGIRFYFDDPDEEELAFIEALLHRRSSKIDGNLISIRDESGKYYGVFYNREAENSLSDDVLLSSDGSYAYVAKESIMYWFLVNLSSPYEVRVNVYGYAGTKVLTLDGLKYANIKLSDDFTFAASLDEDMNLIITSNDENWLEALTRPQTIIGKKWLYHGSFFGLLPMGEGMYYDFFNRYYPDLPEGQQYEMEIELKTDDEGKKYVSIAREVLYDRYEYSGGIDVTGQSYYLEFLTNGYEKFNSDPEKEGEYITFTGRLIRSVPQTITVTGDEDGLSITSSDAHWLKMLSSDKRSEVILHNDETSKDIIFHKDQLVLNDGEVLISDLELKKNGVGEGSYTVHVNAFGYENAFKENVYIINASAMRPMIEVGYANAMPINEQITFNSVNSSSEDLVSSWNWDFGDGTNASGKSVTHAYASAGDYTVVLTLEDVNGEVYETSKTFTVYDPSDENAQYTLLKLSVIDGNDTTAVSGASIFLTGSAEDAETYEVKTDENGYVEVTVKNDTYTVSSAASGYMLRTISLSADGGQKEQSIYIYTNVMSGSVEVTPMTMDEIIAAGIDPEAEGNEQVFKYEVTLNFKVGLKPFEFHYDVYKNNNDEEIEVDDDKKVIYQWIEGPCSSFNPCEIDDGSNPSDDDDDDDNNKSGGIKLIVIPISEKFAMVITGESHWLKEMFQVSLIVNNDSAVETLEDTTAVLSIPEGMSLAEMISEPQDLVNYMGSIGKKESANATWYIRGDAEGDYQIGADVSARTSKYNEKIEQEFVTKDPVHVYAGSALKLSIIADDYVERGKLFKTVYRLENVSDRPVYDLTFGIDSSEQYKVVAYTDGSEKRHEISDKDFGDAFTRYISELAPGGYVELELQTTIWFKSNFEYVKLLKVGKYIDLAYYLKNAQVSVLSGSTTTIPYEVVIERKEREYFIDWLIDKAVEDKFEDLPSGSAGGTLVEFIGDAVGAESYWISKAKALMKLQQGETDYVMSVTIDDGKGNEDSIENDVVMVTAGGTVNKIFDVLNGTSWKITGTEAKFEFKAPGSTRIKVAIEDSVGDPKWEETLDIVVQDKQIKDVVKLTPDGYSDTVVIDKETMTRSLQRTDEQLKEAYKDNPFMWIDSTIRYEIDEKDSDSIDSYKITYFNDDKSGGGVLWSDTHNNIEISGTTATLDFTRQAWQKIAQESGEEFTVSARRLSDEEASVFEVDGPIYEFGVQSGEQRISEFEGTVLVSVPYELTDPDNADEIYVEHFKKDGTSEVLKGTYNAQDKTVSFETASMSYFAIHEGEPEVATLTLDHKAIELLVGEQQQLKVNEGISVTWSSNHEDIAEVDEEGLVTGISAGKAIITVTSVRHPELSDTCTVTVNEPVDPYGEIKEEDRPDDPSEIPMGFWTSEMLLDVEDPNKEILYTGKPITLFFRVYDHNRLLEEGTDYTLKYSNNTKAGTASVTITGKGNYTGTLTKTFEILPDMLSEEDTMVILNKDTFIDNGKAQKPSVSVIHKGVTLKNKTDYTLTYEIDSFEKEDIIPEVYSITIEGKGNYEGTLYKSYEILDKDSFIPVSSLKVSGIKAKTYTGEEILQDVIVKDGSTLLEEDVDYELSYEDNIDAGTGYVIITGLMNEEPEEGRRSYAGSLMKSFKINPVAISAKNTEVSGLEEESEFTGEEILQDLLVMYGDTALEEETDYTLSYKNNIKAGTAAVTIKAMGNYKGSFAKTYKILKANITPSDIDLSDSCEYTKGGVKPLPYIEVNGRELMLNTDYTLSYKNNTKLGTATLTIKPKGSYTSEEALTREFEIVEADISNVTMSVPDKVYSTKANGWKATPVLTDSNGKKLAAGTDYSKTMSYTYTEDTYVIDGSDKTRPEVLRLAGEEVQKADIIPVNTIIEVSVNTEGLKVNNYVGEISERYRIIAADIAKATVTIPAQYYTGDPVEFSENEISVKLGKSYLTSSDFEIESYENNINKGTAYVTIRGIGDYGGSKRVKFTIKQKTMALTIHFNPNGATSGSMKDQMITKDTALTKNAFKKVVDGKTYKFVGWESEDGAVYTDKEVFTYDPLKAGTITTLYAIWE